MSKSTVLNTAVDASSITYTPTNSGNFAFTNVQDSLDYYIDDNSSIDVHVQGNMYISGDLIVAGNINVDGEIKQSDYDKLYSLLEKYYPNVIAHWVLVKDEKEF